jgi:hypothetical protein
MASVDPWTMEANSAGGGSNEVCPSGTQFGVIVGVIDVGTHHETTQDGPKDVRKLVLVIETTKKQTNGQPFVLAEKYTHSFHKMATFRKVASTILGRVYKDGDRFSPLELVGKPVMASITHDHRTKNGTERTYANLKQLSQFPDGMDAPTPTYTPFAWSVMEDKPFPEHDWLPRVYGAVIKDLAEGSRERRGSQTRETIAAFVPLEPGVEDVPY